ncbi:MAG: PHB depolymerase family esterase [Pseudomonadota bacterium]
MLALACACLLAAAGASAGSFTKHEVKVGDATRVYQVYRPNNLKRDQQARGVLAFHGFMSDPSGLRWLTKMDKAADKHGFVVIYPKALGGSFNAGRGSGTKDSDVDEEAFIKALLPKIVREENVDPARLYTLGFSNGAQMSALMLCRFADELAGAALVAHGMNIDDCQPSQPVPSILIQGAKDPYVPFGGGGKHNLTSHKKSVELLKAINKVEGQGKILIDKASVRCRGYGEDVRSCVGYGDGHTWPGGVKFKPDQFGKTNEELAASDFILKFFSRHQQAPKALVAQAGAEAAGGAAATGDAAPRPYRGTYMQKPWYGQAQPDTPPETDGSGFRLAPSRLTIETDIAKKRPNWQIGKP